MPESETLIVSIGETARDRAEQLAPGRTLLDRYYTPARLARAIVKAVGELETISGVTLEPSAGGGAFARAILDLTSAEVIVSDLNPEAPVLMACAWNRRRAAGDRYPCAFYSGREFTSIDFIHPSWIIGNPPFNKAEEHVRHALKLSRRVVFLLRASFSSSKGRISFWKENPPRHVWQLAERPSFTTGATENAEYCVFFWDRDYNGPVTFSPGWSWKSPLFETDCGE